MRFQLSRVRSVAALAGGVTLLASVVASSALAVGPGLPRTYQVQRIEAPIPALSGGFGLSMPNVGDVNNDGEDDFANVQTAGTPNSDGVLQVFSGETGALLKSLNAPDPGNPTGTAGNGRAIVDRFADRMTDIGSCPAPPPAAQADQTCTSAVIGPPDGVSEILLGAEGVDVGGVKDVGRIYVIDGKTLTVLKRVDMPPADRALIAARAAENPSLNVRGGFGRTVQNPRGLPPCAGNAGVGACPAVGLAPGVPQSVRIGDMDGGGQPDIVVGANRFPENGASANPASHCAKTAAFICLDAGRAYIYRGEDIVGTAPNVTLDGSGAGQTVKVIRNLAAQNDVNDETAFRSEILGHAQMPVGDIGSCRTGGAFPAIEPGERCSTAARTTTPDGKADVIIASHRADTPIFNPDPAFFETGVSFLVDGATGAVLTIYNHPEPQPNALFGYTTRQSFALGDLFGLNTAVPDLVLPGVFQNAQNRSQSGRAYIFNGDFTDAFINRGQLNDPTPTPFERFGVPTEGVGDLVPDSTGKNEVLVGNFSSQGGRPDGQSDLHFFNPAGEQVLQTISSPDPQPASSFGYQAVPLGDLNEDGFLDFATSSPNFDAASVGGATGLADQGRIYIFRSDNSPVAVNPGSGNPPSSTPPGSTPPGGDNPGVARAGRSITLLASKSRVARRGQIVLKGRLEAFADPQNCEVGQSVVLQRRRSKSARFKTFKKTSSRAGGAFSARIRPTRTLIYRARVGRTPRCLGAVSAGKAVKVSSRRRTSRRR